MARAQRLRDVEANVASMIIALEARTPRLVIALAPGTLDDAVVRREQQKFSHLPAPTESLASSTGRFRRS